MQIGQKAIYNNGNTDVEKKELVTIIGNAYEIKHQNGHISTAYECELTSITGEKLQPIKADTFEALCQSMIVTHRAKNADYGNSFDKSLDKFGMISALTRISDKYNRLETLMMKGEKNAQVKSESVDDTLIDLANYCLMTLSYRKNNGNKQG